MEKPLNYAAALRAARAGLNIRQRDLLDAAGLAENTVIAAEQGRACSEKTWAALSAYYEAKGVVVEEGEGGALVITVPMSDEARADLRKQKLEEAKQLKRAYEAAKREADALKR